MEQIRRKCFETNSSSVHTLTFDGSSLNDLEVSKDGYVHIELRYYGRERASYDNALDKIRYALIIIAYTNDIHLYWDFDEDAIWDYDSEEEMREAAEEAESDWDYRISELTETPEFIELEKAVIEELENKGIKCKGLKIDISKDCGIDHQSAYNYSSLKEFLECNKIENIHQFIFGKTVLHTDGD